MTSRSRSDGIEPVFPRANAIIAIPPYELMNLVKKYTNFDEIIPLGILVGVSYDFNRDAFMVSYLSPELPSVPESEMRPVYRVKLTPVEPDNQT